MGFFQRKVQGNIIETVFGWVIVMSGQGSEGSEGCRDRRRRVRRKQGSQQIPFDPFCCDPCDPFFDPCAGVPGGVVEIPEKGIAGIAGEGIAGSRGRTRFLSIPSAAIPAIPFLTPSRGSQEGSQGSQKKGSQGSQQKGSQEAGVAADSL